MYVYEPCMCVWNGLESGGKIYYHLIYISYSFVQKKLGIMEGESHDIVVSLQLSSLLGDSSLVCLRDGRCSRNISKYFI